MADRGWWLAAKTFASLRKSRGIPNLKLITRNSQLRIVQLALIAVMAIGFMGADVDARFNKLGHQMMCMCGCNQILLECNHVGCAYSEHMRGELTASLERGDNDSLALQGFVQKYGNPVMSAPTSSGFNVIAWIMPFAMFALAAAIAVSLVGNWKARPVMQFVAKPSPGSAEFDDLRKKARQEIEI